MRRLFIITALIFCCGQSAFASHTDYEILDQKNIGACTEYAVNTCIDIMGEPTKINPLTAYKALNNDGNQNITDTLNYYVSQGAISAYTKITPSAIEIDKYLEMEIPVIVVTWQDAEDWRDGIITVNSMEFLGTHASVIVEKTQDYYVGVNSWGKNWGFAGHYRLYNPCIIGSAFVIEPKENVIF